MVIKSSQIKAAALDIGFHLVGITSIDGHDDQAVNHLKNWLDLGYQADMAWMANPKRENIRQCMPESRSLISLALNYYTPYQHTNDPQIGKISRYGWGRDYHKVVSKKLKALNNWLKSQEEEILTRYYVDTGPVQDKVWAQRAGIGWIGKNANLISRDYGSWIFLSEVLTSLELTPDIAHPNHCGTCDRCLTACPTGAIVQPYVVDANRCIAYHTIENRQAELPEAIADNISGWVAGCDICQDVCPWNKRFAKETNIIDFQPYPENIQPRLHELANISELEWDRRFRGSALRRIKSKMWRRNAHANLKGEK